MSSGVGATPAEEAAWDSWMARVNEANFSSTAFVDNSRRLDLYYNTAKQLLTQGVQYHGIGEDFTAYVYLKRFVLLCTGVIAKHNAYSLKSYEPDRNWALREVRRALTLGKEAKQRYHDAWVSEQRASAFEAAMAARRAAKSAGSAGSGGGDGGDASAPHAAEGGGAVPVVVPEALHAEEGPADAHAPGTGGDVDRDASAALSAKFDILRIDGGRGKDAITVATALPPSAYPEVADGRRSGAGAGAGSGAGAATHARGTGARHAGPSATTTALGGPAAAARRANASGLRNIVLPRRLLATFLDVAEPNTNAGERGIETCGVLAGRVAAKGQLLMTTLVIPKQTGGPDTCAMTDEAGLFNYCMGNDLITLGWIHTHPRQECFLSSVDLHTHCGFQTLMPEAIAIVLAPTDPRLMAGVFRLTHPGGLAIVQKCRRSGFHPHSEGNIYEHSGHVIFDDSAELTVKDLRR